MDTVCRYRSYTSYSEENGTLVPSIEPQEKTTKCAVIESVKIVDRITGEECSIGKEKLKTEALPNIAKPLTNVSIK